MKFYVKLEHFARHRSFKLRDASQGELFRIKGRFLFGLRELVMTDMNNEVLYKLHRRFAPHFNRLYHVHDEEGKILARITKTAGLFRPDYTMTVEDKAVTFGGVIRKHQFSLHLENKKVAEIRRGTFSFGDAYEIEVTTEQKPLLHLFLVIVIDQMNHERKRFRT